MSLSSEKYKVLVLGPGALGCGFAAFLSPDLEHQVHLLGGTRDPRDLDWAVTERNRAELSQDNFGGRLSDFGLKAGVLSGQSWIADPFGAPDKVDFPQSHALLFVFLPTGLEHVVKDLVKDFVSKSIHKATQSFSVIFCSNGIVPVETWQGFPPEFCVFRFLFFTGFCLDKDNRTLAYNGGEKVLCGPLRADAASTLRLQCLLSRGKWPPFRFEWTNDISLEEFVKLYVNWMLFLGAGPRLLANGAAFANMGAELREFWQNTFCHFALARGLGGQSRSPEDFVRELSYRLTSALETTALATASNTNSISRAFGEGDPWPFLSLWDTVNRLNLQSDGGVEAELNALKTVWGVSTVQWK